MTDNKTTPDEVIIDYIQLDDLGAVLSDTKAKGIIDQPAETYINAAAKDRAGRRIVQSKARQEARAALKRTDRFVREQFGHKGRLLRQILSASLGKANTELTANEAALTKEFCDRRAVLKQRQREIYEEIAPMERDSAEYHAKRAEQMRNEEAMVSLKVWKARRRLDIAEAHKAAVGTAHALYNEAVPEMLRQKAVWHHWHETTRALIDECDPKMLPVQMQSVKDMAQSMAGYFNRPLERQN